MSNLIEKFRSLCSVFATNFTTKGRIIREIFLTKKWKWRLIILTFTDELNIKQLLFISSGGSIYKYDSNKVLDESAELNIDNYYKNAKLELSMFSEDFGKDFISLRVSNLFGSPYHKSDVGFVDNLIKKDNSKFKIPTIADTDRVHADEVSRVLDELLSLRTKPSGVFNVGTGISYEITNIYRSFVQKDVTILKPADYGYKLSLDRLNSLGIFTFDKLKEFLQSCLSNEQ